MRYRRVKINGGTYFFTVALADRNQALLVKHADLLRHVFQGVKERHPFTIDAIVIMPEHLHTVWTLPDGDLNYPTRWALIKAGFSRGVTGGERISRSRQAKGERGIWQRRYWEHLIRNEEDFARHVDYIHYNPVKHGNVASPAEWPFSSIHTYTSAGILPVGWGSSAGEISGDFGE